VDKYFRIEKISCTPNPQLTCWLAMHQDYSSYPVMDTIGKAPDETRAGELLVEKCLKFNHWGVTEHVSIAFNCIGFPHETAMQLRTHRVGISFDIQSFRYTSQSILDVASEKVALEEVFYLRPEGEYFSRTGDKYEYTKSLREEDAALINFACKNYARRFALGLSEEHARGLLPMCVRQHFVMSVNARSLMHILDMRMPKDAQLEARQFCELLLNKFKEWMPEVASFYEKKRLGKSKLAP
jgi:thymidylate synthase (FAD)